MKVALITGGSSGIGEASARELAKRGWQVAIMFSKNKAQADRVAGDINGLALQGDVAQDADCRRVAKAVVDKWGRIDALVNSAGTTKFVAHGDLEGLSADDILGIFRINVVGPYQMIRACAPALKEAHGCVVNLSSVAALLTIFIVAIVDWMITGEPLSFAAIVGGAMIIVAFLGLTWSTYREMKEHAAMEPVPDFSDSDKDGDIDSDED